jgi:tetratricopeptide (TPR) repeat protein
MISERIKLLVNARNRNRALIALLLGLMALGLGAVSATAQVDATHPPPPPPSQDAAPPADSSKGAAPPADATASARASATPAFDPLHAEKSLEVGEYYLKSGDYPAAVDRFKEAIGYQSNLAVPWDLLGQACEKEHEREDALTAYQKYLSMVPDGKESDRVRKRVEKLQADIAHDAAKQ